MTPRTILIIDDDTLFRRPVVTRLQGAGYRTVEAGDGARGMELAKRNRPDLVLLDLSMKGGNGVDFLRAFRNNETLRHVPVIVVTAATDDLLLAAAGDVGVEGYMIKTNFTLDDLSALVASMAGPAVAA